MAESKKKVITVVVAVIIVIIILLLILLLFLWPFLKTIIIKNSVPGDYFNYNYTNYTGFDYNYTNYSADGNLIGIPSTGQGSGEIKYNLSGTLTEITFARVVDMTEGDNTWKVNTNVKVTGYLQEIDPTTGHLNRIFDRVFVFKNSNVTWDIYGMQKKEGSNCIFEFSVAGKGSKPIEGLNVDTGDVKRDFVPAAGWGSWALTYTEDGFYTSTPEIALEGFVLIPVVETEITTKLKENSICGYYDTKGPVITTNLALSPQFPLKLINVNVSKKIYSGNLEAQDDSFDTPIGAAAMFEEAQLALPIDLPYDAPGNWKVSWNINLP